jgi:hypothetical protein
MSPPQQSPILPVSLSFRPCHLLAASTAGDLVVDLAVGELVDLVVVLVAHAGLVGEVVDL